MKTQNWTVCCPILTVYSLGHKFTRLQFANTCFYFHCHALLLCTAEIIYNSVSVNQIPVLPDILESVGQALVAVGK